MGAVLALAWTAAAAEVHVAPAGADANPGTEARPLATLEAARAAVRQLRAGGQLPAGGVTVWLHGGDYLRTNALELGREDSGTPTAPVRWQAWAGERPRLLGGRRLSGFEPVREPAVRERFDAAARDHIVVCDLRALGITDFGEMKSRGFARPTTPAHCELFFAGRPMTLARWPNEGEWEKIAGFPAGSGQGDSHGGQIGKLEEGFLYSGDRPRRWQDTSGLWVHGYWSWDWANSYERVQVLDLDARRVKTAPPYGQYGFRKDQRFYFLNVLEELDAPGEWFLDRATGRLYFWPPEPLAGREVLLSLLEQPLLKLTDAAQITLQGLTLEATRGNGVEIRGGESNRLTDCVLRNLGDYGVKISAGRGHGVVGCDVFDTGDGGVDLAGGDRQTLTPAGHFVENCHFQRQGRWSKCYVPAIHMTGVGLRAAHNLVQDHPHCGILFNGNDHLIEFNEIHHIALETGDVGAIYTGRDYSWRGNRLRYNFIHHTGGVGMGSMGVYMDDCVSGTEIFGNIFYQVHWAMFIGGGRDHRVENNLFVDCDPAVRVDGRGLDKAPVWRSMVNDYMRQQLAAVPAALYRERYPAIQSLDTYYGPPGGPAITGDAFQGVPPEGNVVARNVCVGKWLDVTWHAKPEMLKVESNWVGTDPGFETTQRATAKDFRLRADSPVWAKGFQAIPVEKIGLQRK